MFIVTYSASVWFVKCYDLLMKVDANIAAVLRCVLHFPFRSETFSHVFTETSASANSSLSNES